MIKLNQDTSNDIRIKAADEILDLLPIRGGEKINISLLDVGCGEGHLVKRANEREYVAFGIDTDGRINFIDEYSCDYKDFFDEEDFLYDIIIMNHVFEHFANPYATLMEAKHKFMQNGHLVIVVPNIDSPFARSKKWYGWKNGDGGHEIMYTPKTLIFILEKNGFKVLKMKTGTMHHEFPFNIIGKFLAWIGKGDNLIAVAQVRE